MNVLLINCPIDEDYPEFQEPLGIMFLGEMLRQAGHRVVLWDIATQPRHMKLLLDVVAAADFDVVGLSSRTSSYPYMGRLARALRREAGFKGMLIAGGQHVSALPEETLAEHEAEDLVVAVGEAERTMTEALAVWDSSVDSLRNVRGLAFLQDGQYVTTGARELERDIGVFPYPRRDNINADAYELFNIISSRGCPFRCTYCQKNISGGVLRKRPPEDVAEEIELCHRAAPGKEFFFVDDVFTIDRDRVFAIFDLLERKDIHIRWRALSRVNVADKAFMKELKRLGCRIITFGIESGDRETLERIRKGITPEQVVTAVNATAAAGIRVKANFMFGFPWDTPASLGRTLKLAARLPVNGEYAFYGLIPFPGTEIYETARRENLFLDKEPDWINYTPIGSVHIKTEHLPLEWYDDFRYRAAVTIMRRKFFREMLAGRFWKTLLARVTLLTTERIFTAAFRGLLQEVFVERKRLGYSRKRVIRDLLLGAKTPPV